MAPPTKLHSNAFWSEPRAGPRLAVLLLNGEHASWRVAPGGGVGQRGPELFWNLWSHAQLTVCADGGANRLFDRGEALGAQQLLAAPHYIKGDLDSLRVDVREFFRAAGSQVIQDPDQNSNDLDKCLQLIHELQGSGERFSVMIFGAMGGRFDQEMQNVNALFRWKDQFQHLVLLSSETSARLLEPNVRHVIAPNFHFETRTCGLIPVAGACAETSTTGLKWNLSPGMETGFGGLISSSNHVDDACEQVEVLASHPLIWTTELKT
ncbi:unnamed protein product [Phytophthora fragariaefolia]|uniref:Thiamine pyrophosphokinase n=1 Tax=Phytophthora fragariaefolia TaxID=1490495 RepID=A0A9W6YQG2_9STRA|nr:unnamed protein product [Phytophthora fragariaefolia]